MGLEGFRHGRTVVDGVDLHHQRGGSGEPVVLLHGWPQHSLQWHSVAPALAERYDVIVPDLPGCGGSAASLTGYDKRSLARTVAGLLDALEVTGARVVGYDHGAGVAYQLAATRPELVRQLVFAEYVLPGCGYENYLNATPDWQVGSNWQLPLFTIPDVAEFAFRGRERELVSWFFWHAACDPSAVSTEHLTQYTDSVARPGALRAGIEYYAAVWKDLEANRETMATKLSVPGLGIGGRHSIAEYVGMAMGQVVEHAETRVVEDAGHWLSDESPAALTALLTEFFATA